MRLRITARAIGHGFTINEEFFTTEIQDPEETILRGGRLSLREGESPGISSRARQEP